MINSELEKTITNVEFKIATGIRASNQYAINEPYAAKCIGELRALLEECSHDLSFAHRQVKHNGAHKIY